MAAGPFTSDGSPAQIWFTRIAQMSQISALRAIIRQVHLETPKRRSGGSRSARAAWGSEVMHDMVAPAKPRNDTNKEGSLTGAPRCVEQQSEVLCEIDRVKFEYEKTHDQTTV